MNEKDKKLTKHIGEQKPINQTSKPANNSSGNHGNSSDSGNPIKPQETQKGLESKK